MKRVAAFIHSFTVRFADVDHAKIVYYPMFYHYFHVAFEELFRARMGAKAYLALLDEEKIGFPAVHSECDYRSPLRFADAAETAITLKRMGTKSVTLQYEVSRVDGDNRVLAATGAVTCAITDLDAFRAVEIPQPLRTLFLELSGSVG
jgi:4-hydroxybenzoyl-CoA thioesterase